MAAVRDQHGLVVEDAVIDDSRVVRDHDSAADRAVVDVCAGLLLDSVRDRVVHGGRTVRGTDDQGVPFEEDLLTLQLVLSETEPGVKGALECDGREASGGFLSRHGLDGDELCPIHLEDTGSLVAFDPSGPGIRLCAGTTLLRSYRSSQAEVRRFAFGVVGSVVDIVLSGIRDVLERHPVRGGTLVHTDDTGCCQLVRAAEEVVRGVRFSLGRRCRDDAEPVLRDGTDVIEACRLARVGVAPA